MTRIQRWSALTALAVVVVFAAGWFLAVAPQKSHASSLRASVAAQVQQNAVLSGTVQRLNAQKGDAVAEGKKVQAIQQKLPDTPSLPAYVRTLVATAASVGVDLNSISPTAPAAVALAQAAAAAAPAAAATPIAGAVTAAPAGAAAPPLQLIAVAVSVYGSYAQVQQFIADVEGFGRTTLVSSITLAPGARPGAAGSAASGGAAWQSLNATLTLNIFETAPGALGAVPVASASPSTVTN